MARRFVIITLCVCGLGILIWLWRRSGLPEPDLSASRGHRPQSRNEGVDELREPTPENVSQPGSVDGGERLMAELVEIRANVVGERSVTGPASENVPQPELVDGGERLIAELVEIRADAVDNGSLTGPASESVPQPQRTLGYQPSSACRCDDALVDIAEDTNQLSMAELAQIRADVVERVAHRPLFVMGEQRSVPHFQLFFMTKQELFEAVLEAEGLPPHDVAPSPQSAARIKEIAAEAFRLHQKIAADETTHLADDKSA